MNMSEKSHRQFKSIADCLEKKKKNILANWEREINKKGGKFSRLSTFSHEKFIDHMPLFLDNLIQDFRGMDAGEKKAAEKHGEERWENGLNLPQVTKEWSVLHSVIIEELTPCMTDDYAMDKNSLEEIQKIVAKNIHRGIRESVNAYFRLENQKAEAQMDDLVEVFQKREEKVKSHKNGLRQTSHDIKGNLLSLQIAVSMLKDRNFEDQELTDIVNEMGLATEGLEKLLKELLDLFRLEAGQAEIKPSSFDVAKELYELCESLQPMADKEGLDLRCSGDEPLPIFGDRQKVRRIAQNLLLNALKYTDTGSVEISWEQKDKKHWLLKVSDTGDGLPKNHASFLLTETVSKEPSGSLASDAETHDPHTSNHGEGIGLLIVKELCQLLNGIIEVDTAPSEGTTFRIMLPVDISEQE